METVRAYLIIKQTHTNILLTESAPLFPYALRATDLGLLTLQGRHRCLFMHEQTSALRIFIVHMTFTSNPKATIKVNSVYNSDKHSGRGECVGFFMGF